MALWKVQPKVDELAIEWVVAMAGEKESNLAASLAAQLVDDLVVL